jgi:hypothetical protein
MRHLYGSGGGDAPEGKPENEQETLEAHETFLPFRRRGFRAASIFAGPILRYHRIGDVTKSSKQQNRIVYLTLDEASTTV